MKNLAAGILFLMVYASSACGQAGPIRLIVRGDDMGYAHSGNEALVKCYTQGIEQSIEVIVPSPWFPEAVQLLQKHPGVDVGIHLVLTSEWDNVKWRPLTNCPGLTDSAGYFFPMIWPNPNYPGRAVLQQRWTLAEVEREWRAQIELAKKCIPRLSHISGHMGCTGMSDSVHALARRLAAEYDISIDPADYKVVSVGYEGPHQSSAEKILAFKNMLRKLRPGQIYLFVDHPGLNTPELQAIHHIGYETVAEDRQGVTDTWTNEEVKQLIRELGITLISYRDLPKIRKEK